MNPLNAHQLEILNIRINRLERRVEQLEDVCQVPSPRFKAEDSLPSKVQDINTRLSVLEDIILWARKKH